MQLFRSEAIEHQRKRLLGDVVIVQPVSFMLITLSLLALVLIASAFLFFGTYVERETVRGSLVLTSGLMPIQADAAGPVDQIHVDQGTWVEPGDPLMTIRNRASGQEHDGRILLSPVGGVVVAIQVRLGEAVSATTSVMSLRRLDDPLAAELILPTHLAPSIRVGQSVSIAYDDLPGQEHGKYQGVIERVSDSLYLPDQEIGALRLQAPAYKATVRLSAQSFSMFGKTMALQPGMGLRAEITQNRKRLIERLFASGDQARFSGQ